MRFALVTVAAAAIGLATAGCGPEVDLAKSAQIVDVQSGYLDLGVINGKTKIVPVATVHVKNVSDRELSGFQISASYWIVGDDGMKDEVLLPRLVAKNLAPGATSDPIELRASFGYTLEVPRAQAFMSSYFRDFVIKVFGKVGGRMAKLGEFKVDQKILPKDGLAPTT